MLVILAFMALIPASKHLHLVLSPITVFLKSPELGNLPNLDFEKEQVGLETVKDLGSKSVLDAFTCVECGRCQVNCPAWGAGKELNPKTIILQTQEALLAGDREHEARRGLLGEGAVAVHDLRRLREPVPGRHRAPADPDRLAPRPGVERRRAGVSRRDVQQPRAPQQHLGSRLRPAHEVRARRRSSRPSIRRSTTCWSGSAAPARSTPTSRSRCSRCSRSCAPRREVRRAVEGEVHRRSGQAHRQRVHVPGAGQRQHRGSEGGRAEEDPDVVPALREDDRRRLQEVRLRGRDRPLVGLHRGADARRRSPPTRSRDKVTFHDPCYLGRYAGKVDEPRALLERFGADISEPERNRDNPYCCGAGGGLLFADKEEEPGTRISDVRFKQLQATGAEHRRHRLPVLLDHAEGRAGAARRPTRSSST